VYLIVHDSNVLSIELFTHLSASFETELISIKVLITKRIYILLLDASVHIYIVHESCISSLLFLSIPLSDENAPFTRINSHVYQRLL